MRRPRKLKKAIKKAVIIIDVTSIPAGWTLQKYDEIFCQTGICFYDSDKGKAPRIVSFGNKRIRRKTYKKIDGVI